MTVFVVGCICDLEGGGLAFPPESLWLSSVRSWLVSRVGPEEWRKGGVLLALSLSCAVRMVPSCGERSRENGRAW